MVCEKCGKEVAEGEQCCGYCGAKLTVEENEGAVSPESASRKGKGKSIIIIGIAAAAVLIAAAAVFLVFNAGLKAKSMSLHDYKGNIVLSNDSGEEQEIFKDRRMADGDALTTGDESKAYVMLEKDRLVTLMGLSKAQFHKSGAELTLTLSEGSLFFNIVRKLDEEESLEIETSNVVLSIRGTSGYVDADENGSEVLYLTSGEVHFRAKSPVSGEREDGDVKAGQKLTVTILDDGSLEVKIEAFPETALPAEAAEEILGDAELRTEVMEATGWDAEALSSGVSQTTGTDVSADKNEDPDALITVHIPETVVDGYRHHAYYDMEIGPYTKDFLDSALQRLTEGDYEAVAPQLGFGGTDPDTLEKVAAEISEGKQLMETLGDNGFGLRVWYKEYAVYLIVNLYEDGIRQGAVSFMPTEGPGYFATSSYNTVVERGSWRCGTCTCSDGMFNGQVTYHGVEVGDPYFCIIDAEGTVKNGVFDGEFNEHYFYQFDDLDGYSGTNEDTNIRIYENGYFVSGYLVSTGEEIADLEMKDSVQNVFTAIRFSDDVAYPY